MSSSKNSQRKNDSAQTKKVKEKAYKAPLVLDEIQELDRPWYIADPKRWAEWLDKAKGH